MRVASSFIVLASLVVVGFSAPNAKRTLAQVEADISTVATQVNALDSAINGFPDTGGSLIQALAIHSAAGSLESSLGTATTDTEATPAFSDTDGQTILSAVQPIVPVILDALTAIVAKKPAFQALPLGGVPALVKQDLGNLSASTEAFENALIASTPASLQDQAQQLKATIDAAFANAIAAYA